MAEEGESTPRAEPSTYFTRLCSLVDILSRMEVTGSGKNPIGHEDGFAMLRRLTDSIKRNNRTIFMIGNGASASMASHIAADLCKNGNVNTDVFTDLALLTAIANDLGVDHLFVAPLERRARKGDMLVAISSSGCSTNIIKAALHAGRNGMTVVTFSAMAPDNPLRTLGHLNFYVPAESYGCAESAHAVLLHQWVDLMIGDTPATETRSELIEAMLAPIRQRTRASMHPSPARLFHPDVRHTPSPGHLRPQHASHEALTTT